MSETMVQAPQTEPPRKGLRGWVKAVFALSLTLNFLVLGVVAGGIIGHARHLPPPGGEREASDPFTLGPLSGAFSREDRAAMRRAAEGQGTDFRAMRGAIRGDFDKMEAALRAEPFDEATVRAVLADMRTRTLKRMDLGEEVMLARLRTMSPEARAAFAERLHDGFARIDARIGRGHDDAPGGAPGGEPPPRP